LLSRRAPRSHHPQKRNRNATRQFMSIHFQSLIPLAGL
jgi:hypothetical protein